MVESMNAERKRLAVLALLLLALTGCASTSTAVDAGGTSRGMGGSATVTTGVKF
jgi:hypothetical protein